jgi:small subunit ribosomal protein S8
MITDPLADLLTRIRNAGMAQHPTVKLPSSTRKVEVLRVLKEEGYIEDYSVGEETPQPNVTVALKYLRGDHVITGIKRESKPGQRKYVRSDGLPIVLNGLGVSVITTSQGVMTGKSATAKGVGGEYICSVW